MKVDLKEIIRNGYCTGCGGCVALDNTLTFDSEKSRPKGRESKNVVSKICAGYDIPISKLKDFVFGKTYEGKEDELLGNYFETLLTRSTDKTVRKNASSGGLISSLLIYALNRRLIDVAVVAGKDKKKPYLTIPVFVTDRDGVIKTAGSSYAMCPSLLLLKEARRRGYKRVGLVAQPCVIETLRKIQMLGLTKQWGIEILFVIGSFCSGVSPYNYSTETLITRYCGTSLQEVREIKYREGKYPGNFVVRTKNNKEVKIPFHRMVWFSTGIKKDRCQVCLDRGSELADIAVGDTKLPQMDADFHQTDKFSGAIVRTEVGRELIHQAERSGFIKISKLNPEILRKNLGLNRKLDAQIKRQERKEFGIKIPRIY